MCIHMYSKDDILGIRIFRIIKEKNKKYIHLEEHATVFLVDITALIRTNA